MPVPKNPERSVTGTLLVPGSATVDDNGRSLPRLIGACSARTLATRQARSSMVLLVQRMRLVRLVFNTKGYDAARDGATPLTELKTGFSLWFRG